MPSVRHETARQTLEALMSTINWTTHPFIESFKKEGLEEGLEEGRQAGLAEGKAEDVLKLIDARGIKVMEEERGQVTASAGLTNLDKWFDRALTAKTAEDIFWD
jgi:predicted transposase YdaD